MNQSTLSEGFLDMVPTRSFRFCAAALMIAASMLVNADPAVTKPKDTKKAAAPAQKKILPAPKLDCTYRIPAETTHVEPSLVVQWAIKAVQQSFDFDYNSIDKQMLSLKSCYTDQGWQGFNDALQKSGNQLHYAQITGNFTTYQQIYIQWLG